MTLRESEREREREHARGGGREREKERERERERERKRERERERERDVLGNNDTPPCAHVYFLGFAVTLSCAVTVLPSTTVTTL